MARLLLAAFLGLQLCSVAFGCIYLYGDSPDTLVNTTGKHWDYKFNGDDWSDDSWACSSGRLQSPIDLHPSSLPVQRHTSLKTKFTYPALQSTGSNIQVINNGHTIQVQADQPWGAKITVPTQGRLATDVLSAPTGGPLPNQRFNPVDLDLLQLHFHTDSEHRLNGMSVPLELHLVHRAFAGPGLANCPAIGCLAVVGIMIKVEDTEDNGAFSAIIDNAPFREGATTLMPAGQTLDIAGMMPQNTRYVTYQGSLTAPPCVEGLLWHVLTTPVTISTNQFKKFKNIMSSKVCTGHNNDTDHDDDRRKLFKRKLLQDQPTALNCTLGAWGSNSRIVQSPNGRTVRLLN